ncbi:MAG: TlpA family protein disulfide reductase, partial [Saprospiraceae bacterium]
KYFQFYLEIFMNDQAKKDENLGLTDLELADKYLSGETKDFFKTRMLSLKIRSGNLEPYLFHTKRFIEETPFPKHKETVKNALRSFNGVLTGMPAHNFSLKDENGKTVNLSQFKGKVIYIDFWATWCQSCIHQIQNSGYLRNQFGDSVVFLYISLDNTKGEWESYMKRTPLEGTHVFAEGALTGEVAQGYGVRKLPAVYLIDKNGKIAHSPAKLPNQAGIVQQIQDLLNEK